MSSQSVRLREVVVGVFGEPAVADAINPSFAAVCEAINIRLDRERLTAPFSKLTVETGDTFGHSDVRVAVVLGVADALVPFSARGLTGQSANATRAATCSLILAALDAIQELLSRSRTPWDDGRLRQIALEEAGHGGPWTFEGLRSVRDRFKNLSYRTAYTFDESASRVELVVTAPSGELVRTLTLASSDNFRPLSRIFPAVSIRLIAGELLYLGRAGSVVARVQVGTLGDQHG